MTKSIQWLDSFVFNVLPLILFVLDAALVHVTKPLLSIIASIYEQPAIPQYHSVVSSLAGTDTCLLVAHIVPLLFGQIIVKQVLIKVPTFLLVASEEVEFVVVKDAFGSRSGQGNLALAWQELPLVVIDIILKQVILTIIVVSASKEVDLLLNLDAIVSSPRSEVAVSNWLDLPPYSYLQVHEVLIREEWIVILLLQCAR